MNNAVAADRARSGTARTAMPPSTATAKTTSTAMRNGARNDDSPGSHPTRSNRCHSRPGSDGPSARRKATSTEGDHPEQRAADAEHERRRDSRDGRGGGDRADGIRALVGPAGVASRPRAGEQAPRSTCRSSA